MRAMPVPKRLLFLAVLLGGPVLGLLALGGAIREVGDGCDRPCTSESAQAGITIALGVLGTALVLAGVTAGLAITRTRHADLAEWVTLGSLGVALLAVFAIYALMPSVWID